VVAFDNVGVAATTGTTPATIDAMAHGAIAFPEAIDVHGVDLLGFSIGSFVAQEIALIGPDLLRRVVLASSAPQGASGMHGWAPEVIGAVGVPGTSPQRMRPRPQLEHHRRQPKGRNGTEHSPTLIVQLA
jgi:pimeloyl-ACP methyl ester carboxylesterase